MSSACIILGTTTEGRCQIVIRLTDDLVQKGLDANQLIQKIAPMIDGGGGGKKNMAQAGGKNPDKLSDAYLEIEKFVTSKC